jgi:hypothetical protein
MTRSPAPAKSKRKHEDITEAPQKSPKPSAQEKAAMRAQAAAWAQKGKNEPVATAASLRKTVARKSTGPVSASASKSPPRKALPVAKKASPVAKKQAAVEPKEGDDDEDYDVEDDDTEEDIEIDTDDEDEIEIVSPHKKRRISAPPVAAAAPSAAAVAKSEKQRMKDQDRATVRAWVAKNEAEKLQLSANKLAAAAPAPVAIAPRPSPTTPPPPRRQRMPVGSASTSASTTAGRLDFAASGTADRKPSYRTSAATTTASAATSSSKKKSHRMDDKMPFHSPKPRPSPEVAMRSVRDSLLLVNLPSLPDPPSSTRRVQAQARANVETVQEDEADDDEALNVGYTKSNVPVVHNVVDDDEDDDNVEHAKDETAAATAEWKSAVGGFLLVVLFSFFITGLHQNGVVTGDFGGGLKSFVQSMETHLENASASVNASGIGIGHAQSYLATWWSMTLAQAASKKQPTLACFEDSPEENVDDDFNVALVAYCAGAETVFLPCPKAASCAGGVLERCNGRHYEVSPAGDHCLLTEVVNATILQYLGLLHEWTVHDECHRDGCPYVVKHDAATGRPLFAYAQLVGEMELGWDRKIAEAANYRAELDGKQVFITERDGDNHLIGLHSDQFVALPSGCALKKSVQFFLGALAMAVWLVFQAVFAWLWDLVADVFFSFPLVSTIISVVGLVGLWIVSSIRKVKSNKRKLLRDIVECRDKVCRILADRQEHQTIHIRDQISFEVCPTSKVGRTRILQQVWPRVVGDIRQDTRVDKRVVAVADIAGNATDKREYWKWIDAADPAPGHVRFHGAANANGGSTKQ